MTHKKGVAVRVKSKACCTWETFYDGFLSVWDNGCSKKSPRPPRELIDWDMARKHWQRYSMTGGEAARMQLLTLSDDVPYGYHFPRPQGPSEEDGGGNRITPEPSPTPLCPVLARS